MNKIKFTKGKIECLICAAIIFACYILQKVIAVGFEPTRNLLLVQAFVYTLAIGVVYFVVANSKETEYGILVALFGFRMLPPALSRLADFSFGAYTLYQVVEKVSLLIFALLIIKLYYSQSEDKKISFIPILTIAFAVPFSAEISEILCNYLSAYFSGNLMPVYITQAVFYGAALIVTLLVAVRSDKYGGKLICNYELVALVTQIGRRICSVIIRAVSGYHISNSYYCWIAIYAFFFVVFFVLRKKKLQRA